MLIHINVVTYVGKRGTEVKMQGMEKVLKNLGKRSADADRSINGVRGNKTRKGFTLVELIVVLALIGLLVAVSAGGIVGYTTYSTYKRNNENAKTIFSAAQSALTYYKASGKLDGLRRDVEGLSLDPAYVPQDAIADAVKSDGSDTRKDYSTISYLKMSATDYPEIEDAVKSGAQTLDGVSGVSKETALLFDMLSDYVTDVSIYNASICVEFDAQDGVVSGVLYSDKGKSFVYGEGSDDAMDISQRGESYRRRVGLGYYSTELSERAPQEEVKDLKISDARMVNGETLDVQWFLQKKYQYLKSAQSYTIELFESNPAEETSKKLAEIVLDKAEVLTITRERGNTPYVKAKSVTLYNEAGEECRLTSDGYQVVEGEADPGEAGDSGVRFHAYLVQDSSDKNYGSGIALSLDVMDSYTTEAMEISAPVEQQKALLSTYSARRLGYDAGGKHYGLNLDGTGTVWAEVSIEDVTDSGKTTAEAENLFFATKGKSDDDAITANDKVYEVANARHLYNVGLREQATKSAPTEATYKIVKNIAWGGPNGLLSYTGSEDTAGGDAGEGGEASEAGETAGEGETQPDAPTGKQTTARYYAKQNAYEYTVAAEGEQTYYPAFPGIAVLNANSTLIGAAPQDAGEDEGEEKGSGKDGEITIGDGEDGGTAAASGLTVIDYLTLEPQQKADGTVSATGLVRENNGTIQNLALQHVDVRGISRQEGSYVLGKNVGAFCGQNNGTLTNLETVSGYVNGSKNVGGIVGSFGSAVTGDKVSGLKNGAEVSGLTNVGGIVGVLENRMSLTGAENSGIVYGYPEELLAEQPELGVAQAQYIGGIAGIVRDSDTKIIDCVSNPAPQKGAAGSGAADAADGSAAASLTAEAVRQRLYGSYVGGIAGCLTGGATIENSATGTDGGASYVIGENFVGGIIGLNEGGTLTAGERNSNGATVIGRRFVGGVVGVNGGTSDLSAATHADIMAGWDANLSGWTNNGMVIGASAADVSDYGATDAAAYIGGVVGLNAGMIENCSSAMPDPAENSLFIGLGGANADYVGGIAGCNKGSLTATAAALSGAVRGRNYVGGVVGYNDGTSGSDGTISGYTGAGISLVDGNCFVGGVTGLNTSAALLTGTISSQTAAVQGNSYVGGYAGANIVAGDSTISNAQSAVGSVTATGAFAGGLFGYNRVVDSSKLAGLFAGADAGTGSGGGDVTRMVSYAPEAGGQDASGGLGLVNLVAEIFGIDENDSESGSMTIQDGSINGSVQAGIFAGGVLGYNAAKTNLTISEYTGSAVVTATGAVTDIGKFSAKYGAGKSYSFSGGIIGYVSENTTLDACNLAGGNVTASGATYLGGLAEVNEGKITNCAVSAIGDGTHAYVGGIVGVNGYVTDPSQNPAVITSSTASNVSGSDVVGGTAAENYGQINVNGVAGTTTGATTVIGSGRTGGVAGTNVGTISISNISEGSVNVQTSSIMSASASYIGGVAGENYGTITSAVAGGYAQVAINLSGSADAMGGVAGRNEGTISNVELTGSIGSGEGGMAKNGSAYGGIAGVNTGAIDQCKIGAAAGSAGNLLMNVSGVGCYVGGVAGRNSGKALIQNILPYQDGKSDEYISTVHITTAGALATGGIVGANEEKATVKDAHSGRSWSVRASGNAGPVGGIIGLQTSSAGLYDLKNHAGTVNGSDGESGDIVSPGEDTSGGSAQAGVFSDGEAAGGIVGRVEQSEANPGAVVTIQNCVNYGPVQAAGKAGGILGEWASEAGGSIRGCVNGVTSTESGEDNGDTQAAITAATASSAAGIVGSFTKVSAKVTILSCTNFGVINNPFGAGIAALAGAQPAGGDGAMAGSVEITDCANAGRLMNGGAGIAVYDNTKSGGIALTLNRCRNYGRPVTTELEDQFAGLAANVAGGSLDLTGAELQQKRITVKNSIGVANVKYPTVPMQDCTEEEYKNKYKEVSSRYSGSGEPDDVYYYSAQPKEGESGGASPELIKTAGTGYALSWETGLYQKPGVEEPGADKADYLIAKDQSGSGNPFDPNGDYAQDCRGNYNRLDVTLAGACLSLEKNATVDVEKTPSATNLKAQNNGGFLDITWENEKEDDTGADSGEESETGRKLAAVYKTKLELRLYEDRSAARADTDLKTEPIYTATLYGEVTSHTVHVLDAWIGKWVKVTVTNYSYNNTAQEKPVSCVKQILRTLADPEVEVRLETDGNGNPGYVLRLKNGKEKYDPDNYLKLEISTEEIAEEGAENGAGETSSTMKMIPLSNMNGGDSRDYTYWLTKGDVLGASAKTEGGAESDKEYYLGSENADVRLKFSGIQVCPKDIDQSVEDGAEESGTRQTLAKVDPSAVKSMEVQIPAQDKLSAFIDQTLSSFEKTDLAVRYNVKGAPAKYRAELLMDVEEGDYLLKDIVVSSAVSENSNSQGFSGQLPIPQGQADSTVSVRVYPIEMPGGMPKLGYLVAEGPIEDLTAYLEPVTGGTQPTAADVLQAVANAPQAAEGASQIAAVADQLAAQGQTPQTTAEGDSAQGGTEGSQEPQKNLTTMKAKAGYSIERYGENAYRVYSSALLTLTQYKGSVFSQSYEPKQETMPANTIGGGAASQIASTGGGSSSDQTESDTESETETEETEEYTEAQSDETEQPSTDPSQQTESDNMALLPPETYLLNPSWETPPISELSDLELDDVIATSEEYFLESGLSLLVVGAGNEGGFRMRAAFYDSKPATEEPDVASRLLEADMYDGETAYEMVDPAIGYYTFRDLPLSYAGKWLCVQFCSVSADGQRSSDWSGYKWIQLPKIRLKAPELKETAPVSETYVQEFTPPATAEDPGTGTGTTQPQTETVTLQHLAYSWTQNVAQDGNTPKAGERARGYQIELYRMLAAGVAATDDLYKNPTAVVNLMRGGNDEGYYLERRYTAQEIKDWNEQNPDGPLLSEKDVYHIQAGEIEADDPELDEALKNELTANPNLRLYELTLDDKTLGHTGCEVSYVQEDAALGKKEIKGIYPKIQIREYLDEATNKVSSIEYRVILPDVTGVEGEQGTFLHNYAGVYCTHSVIVSQLLHSVFDENTEKQDEAFVADRRQASYLVKTDTKNPAEEGKEELLNDIRILKPGKNYDEPFNPEKELGDPNAYPGYELLPRSYKAQLVRPAGSIEQIAAAMQVALQTDDLAAMDVDDEMSFTFGDDGSMVLDGENDTVPGDTTPDSEDQSILADDGMDIGWADDGIILDDGVVWPEPQTQMPMEPQPQTPAAESQIQALPEPQTQAPTEPQTQVPAEPQTQAAAVPAQELTEIAAEVPAEASMDPGAPVEEVVP